MSSSTSFGSNVAADSDSLPPGQRPASAAWRAFLKLNRTLHIYLTMLALLMLSFFSVTGFMLNHDTWFQSAQPHTRTATGKFALEMLKNPDKLAIVEKLRADFGASGAVTDFDTSSEDSLRVTFKSPGRQVEAAIDRQTGAAELTFESRGLAGRITDLHKGAEAGTGWKRIIDGVAIFLALSIISGGVMWWSLPKRRKIGLAALVAGGVLSLAVYFIMVP